MGGGQEDRGSCFRLRLIMQLQVTCSEQQFFSQKIAARVSKIKKFRFPERRKTEKKFLKKFRGENLKSNSNHSVECGGSVYFLLRSDGRGLFILLLFGRQLAFALQGQFAFPLGGGCSGSGVFLPFTFGRNFRHQWLFPRQRESSRCFCEETLLEH